MAKAKKQGTPQASAPLKPFIVDPAKQGAPRPPGTYGVHIVDPDNPAYLRPTPYTRTKIAQLQDFLLPLLGRFLRGGRRSPIEPAFEEELKAGLKTWLEEERAAGRLPK